MEAALQPDTAVSLKAGRTGIFECRAIKISLKSKELAY